MSLRTILLPVSTHEGQAPLTTMAINLARRFGSHITAMHVKADPRASVPFIGDGMSAEVVKELVHMAEKDSVIKAKESHTSFVQDAHKANLTETDGTQKGAGWSWDESTGQFGERLGRMARVHDLTLVPQPRNHGEFGENEFLNEALFRSGRAVLMVPKSAKPCPCKTVLIAWNGGAEEARAVASSMPLLMEAGRIQIVVVGPENPERPSGHDLAHMLQRHGLKPQVIEADTGTGSVAQCILSMVDREGIDLLVIGAYSHNRWREMVLGGVTREIIDAAPIPVFMSH